MINIDAGRFLFQQRYHLYERNVYYSGAWYNEVLDLTNYFFLTPVIVEYEAIWKQKLLDIS